MQASSPRARQIDHCRGAATERKVQGGRSHVKNGTYLVYESGTRWDKGQTQHSNHVKCDDIEDLHMNSRSVVLLQVTTVQGD